MTMWQRRARRSSGPSRTALAALVLAAAAAALAAAPSRWKPLQEDRVHDPKSPALALLQQPADALSQLPPDSAGNMVNWVKAIETGAIQPRTNILPETQVRIRDDSIIISKFGSMAAVRFPHRQHTLWLDCSNCHEKLFKSQAGANRFSMQAILDGQQCGLCHGAVAFPLTECNRCHNTPNSSLQRRPTP
jgi:c(7)-type cytochrome triheme protein